MIGRILKIIVLSIVGLIVLSIASCAVWGVYQTHKSDTVFAQQRIIALTKTWDIRQLAPYMAQDFAAGWTADARTDLKTIITRKNTPKDLVDILAYAAKHLGSATPQSDMIVSCTKWPPPHDIICMAKPSFSVGQAEIVLRMQENKSGKSPYLITGLVIEYPMHKSKYAN